MWSDQFRELDLVQRVFARPNSEGDVAFVREWIGEFGIEVGDDEGDEVGTHRDGSVETVPIPTLFLFSNFNRGKNCGLGGK